MTEKQDTCGQCTNFINFTSYKNLSDGRGYCTAEIPAWVRNHIDPEHYETANETREDCTDARFFNLFNPRNLNK